MSSDEESVSGQEYESEEEVEAEESVSDDDDDDDAPKAAKKRGRGKAKKKKDPNKPKRNMSAFFLYSNANRARVKSENPGVPFGEIAKIMSTEFKGLPDKEKKKWEKKAEKDKARYQTEMKGYIPPSDESGDDQPKRKAKKSKDPNKPKRNQSAYFIYSNEVRSSVKAENPSAGFGDIAKIISQRFKALSEKEKRKYEKMAEKDKERYQREMDSFNADK